MILSISEALSSVGDYVNDCLAFLGMDFSDITADDWWSWFEDFAIQILATVILFILFRKFLWKPLTEMIEKRKEQMDKELSEAKEANIKAQALKNDLEKQLSTAQEEVKRILQNAEMDGNARKDEIVADAKAEAKRRLEDSKAQVAKEISNKQQEIKDTIVSVAFEAASKVLEKEVDKDKYLKVVNKIIEGANVK